MIIRGDKIISFLEGKTTDYKGRSFASMLDWTNEQLEQCHDQVQWMFPLHEESKHASTYPIVDKSLIEEMELLPDTTMKIRIHLRAAKDRLERFLGIGIYNDTDIQRKWCRDRNHNLLRVTRIIRCLRLFGLPEESKNFHSKVCEVGNRLGISQVTLSYWRRALNEDVWSSLQ